MNDSYWYTLVYFDQSNKNTFLTCSVTITDKSYRIEYILPEGFYLSDDTAGTGASTRPHSINPRAVSNDSYTAFVESFYENDLEPYSNNDPGLQQKLLARHGSDHPAIQLLSR